MKTITISTCGAAKETPGPAPAAIGVHVTDAEGETVLQLSESIGNATAEYAAYFSVVRGLQAVQEKFAEQTNQMHFTLRQESQLVDNHLHATQEIKDVSLIGHFIEIYNLRVASFPDLALTQVQPTENAKANRLVSEVLDAL